MGFFKRVGTFGLGGIVGTGIGAIVASMLAPQTGEDLQKSINARIDEARAAGAAAEAETRQQMAERFRRKVSDPGAHTGDRRADSA
jgi:gas vesicle protein